VTLPPEPAAPVRRPARRAQALALAHCLQATINRGDYHDRAELARQLGFTRARVTRLLDLLLVAPDIQERVVQLEAVDGVEPMAERAPCASSARRAERTSGAHSRRSTAPWRLSYSLAGTDFACR
jgi:hypothetical protein